MLIKLAFLTPSSPTKEFFTPSYAICVAFVSLKRGAELV